MHDVRDGGQCGPVECVECQCGPVECVTEGNVVQWLGRWVCSGFESHSNLWLGFVSGCP